VNVRQVRQVDHVGSFSLDPLDELGEPQGRIPARAEDDTAAPGAVSVAAVSLGRRRAGSQAVERLVP
jgi:hypothetical protein